MAWTEATVAVITQFTMVAARVMRVAGGKAEDWPAQRGLLGSVGLAGSLAACWHGDRTSYALQLPVPIPAWWR